MKKTTIYDIAQKTGFSVATVSRVLSGVEYPVSQKTRDTVEAAARELQYASQFASRLFDRGVNNEIGVLIPNLSNFHYTGLLQGIQSVTTRNSCQILLCDSLRSPGKEQDHVRQLIHKGVKGVLIASMDASGESIRALTKGGIPVVAMEQQVEFPCITTSFNFFAGGQLAVEHLVERGHTAIGFVSPPLVRPSRREVMAGFQRGLHQAAIALHPSHIFFARQEPVDTLEDRTLFEFGVGAQAVDRFLALDPPPTALFCINDLIAMGALRRLGERGVSTPHQMAVVGFDNIGVSAMMTPSLTTIDHSAFVVGKTAATLLFDKLRDPGLGESMSVVIEPHLVVREST